MNIRLICIGKTEDKRIEEMCLEFQSRLKHYVNFELEILSLKKKPKTTDQLAKAEGELVLEKLDKSVFLILMDERGKNLSSRQFSSFIQKRMNSGLKEVVFLIGGAFGFSEELYERADAKVSLSDMTFTHQMVRLILIEQIYRGFTILKGEKYHH